MDWASAAGAVIVALITTVVAQLLGRQVAKAQAKQAEGTAADSISDAAAVLVAQYRTQAEEYSRVVKRLEKRVGELETEVGALRLRVDDLTRENTVLRRGVCRLVKQLKTHEISPSWTPDDEMHNGSGQVAGA